MSAGRRLRWIAPGLLAATAAVGCGARVEKQAEANAGPRPVMVTVAPVARRPVERVIEAVGTLKGWESVSIGSKKMGRVVRVVHDMGDRVKPGELMVEMETADAKLAVEQARRKLEVDLAKLGLKELPGKDQDIVENVPSVVKARVALQRNRQELARQRSLIERRAGIVQDFQNAENNTHEAEAALEDSMLVARSTLATAQSSKVAIEVAEQELRDMNIYAPVPSGTPRGPSGAGPVYAVTKRSVAEGQLLRQGDAVFDLVIEDPLRLWATVPERHVLEVEVGQKVRVFANSRPGEAAPGEVARINPSVDPVSRTFQVEVAVPNREGKLRPGGFAKAAIVTRTDDEATVVPVEAIVQFAGVTKLFVVHDDKAHAIEDVRVGQQGRGWVEVISPAIPAQARVVTTGMSQLAEGTTVVVRPTADDPAPAATAPPAATASAAADPGAPAAPELK